MTQAEYNRLRQTPRTKRSDPYYGHLAQSLAHLATAEQLLLETRPTAETSALIKTARASINALSPLVPDYIDRPAPVLTR
jgi:hypothetical protein